jgi:hypothetical protein
MWDVVWAWLPIVIAWIAAIVAGWSYRASKRTNTMIVAQGDVIERQDLILCVLMRENRELRRVALECQGGEEAAIAAIKPYRFVPN